MQFERCTDCVHKKINYNHKNMTKIFHKSLESVNTRTLIKSAVKKTNGKLQIYDRIYELNKCYVVGFGKAILNMAIELEGILGENLTQGICSIPAGMLSTDNNRQMAEKSKIKFMQGAKDNLPDNAAEGTAKEIYNLVRDLEKGDLLIVLISGGGSALLPLPRPNVTLEEKTKLIRDLSKNGANIFELNCVRKRLSLLKGGGLARLAYPANVVSLILSDVIGDPLDIIASGPTTPNFDDPGKALEVINLYGLTRNLSKGVIGVLKSEMDQTDIAMTPIKTYIHVENYMIGTNRIAAEAAKSEAIRKGYQAVILSLEISRDVNKISSVYAQICVEIAHILKNLSTKDYFEHKLMNFFNDEISISDEAIQELLALDFTTEKGICIIAAGEPTVVVKGKGLGGRNLHLALQFSVDVNDAAIKENNINNMNISLLSCGTDGIDGPTDAAGAIGSSKLYDLAMAEELDPERFLRNSDSYNFYKTFRGGEYMIKTGHTGTNVMDIHLMIINKGYVFEDEEDKARLAAIEYSRSFHC